MSTSISNKPYGFKIIKKNLYGATVKICYGFF